MLTSWDGTKKGWAGVWMGRLWDKMLTRQVGPKIDCFYCCPLSLIGRKSFKNCVYVQLHRHTFNSCMYAHINYTKMEWMSVYASYTLKCWNICINVLVLVPRSQRSQRAKQHDCDLFRTTKIFIVCSLHSRAYCSLSSSHLSTWRKCTQGWALCAQLSLWLAD